LNGWIDGGGEGAREARGAAGWAVRPEVPEGEPVAVAGLAGEASAKREGWAGWAARPEVPKGNPTGGTGFGTGSGCGPGPEPETATGYELPRIGTRVC